MKKCVILACLIIAVSLGVCYAQTESNTNNKTQKEDWAKKDKLDKRRWRYLFQGNYLNYSYNLKADIQGNPSQEFKCNLVMTGISFGYEKQFESGFFNEGSLYFAKGRGKFKSTMGDTNLDKASLFEWKEKVGIVLPINEDDKGNVLKMGPFSGFNLQNISFHLKEIEKSIDDYQANIFFSCPVGVRTEYSMISGWKFSLDIEYDFIISEDSFRFQYPISIDEWHDGHVFQLIGNISKGVADNRLTFKLSPFYRFVDYGECEMKIYDPENPGTFKKEKGVFKGKSHELGLKFGVQF
ncbi:MAG: hypothetical protein LBB37_00015 [Endomicrobium sp.]|nr:hypothetical protein [Endomicrobium sp.]